MEGFDKALEQMGPFEHEMYSLIKEAASEITSQIINDINLLGIEVNVAIGILKVAKDFLLFEGERGEVVSTFMQQLNANGRIPVEINEIMTQFLSLFEEKYETSSLCQNTEYFAEESAIIPLNDMVDIAVAFALVVVTGLLENLLYEEKQPMETETKTEEVVEEKSVPSGREAQDLPGISTVSDENSSENYDYSQGM